MRAKAFLIILALTLIGGTHRGLDLRVEDLDGAGLSISEAGELDSTPRAATDCTTETGGVANEICIDSTAGPGTGIWRCPSPGDCSGTTSWERVDDTSVGSGDNITVNGAARSDADFDDATPAAPSNAVNVIWQADSSAPDNISAHLLLTDIDGDGISVSGSELIVDRDAIYIWTNNHEHSTSFVKHRDEQPLQFGTSTDWDLRYQEGTDDQLILATTNTAALTITDPMFQILVGTTPTANQQVFGIAKGTQATNTDLFTLDEKGDGYFTGELRSQSIQDLDGPGTNWSIDASGNVEWEGTLTTPSETVLSGAELDRLDGLAGIIVTDTTIVTEIDGNGLEINAGVLAVELNGTLDGVGSTGNLSGMEFTATFGLALLQGCNDAAILKWDNTAATWDCAADVSSAFNSTEINDTTWGDNSETSIDWIFNSSGGSNLVVNFGQVQMTLNGTIQLDDGVGDSPSLNLVDATNNLWALQVLDATHNLDFRTNSASTEVLVIRNTGAGNVDVDIDGALTLGTPLVVLNGGTGATTLTDGGILLGSGAGAITALGAAANGQIPIGDGTTDPVLATITGTANEITVTNGPGTITLSVPAPLKTEVACAYIETPVTAEDLNTVWRAPVAITITEIFCETDAGTSGLDLTNDDGSATAVNGSDISCTTSGVSQTSFSGDTTFAQDDKLDINVGTVSTATRLSVCWRYTYD